MEADYLSDEKFINVENDIDCEKTVHDISEKIMNSARILENSEGDNLKTSQMSPSARSHETKKSIEQTKIFSPQKLQIPPFRNKNTLNSKDVDKKDELNNILFGIMNKLFSARVVLKRLPNSVLKEISTVKKPITRNIKNQTVKEMSSVRRPMTRNIRSPVVKELGPVRRPLPKNIKNRVVKENSPVKKPITKNITKNHEKKALQSNESGFCREGTAYKRLCPKCKKPPAARKTKVCHRCKIEFIYECQICKKQLKNYRQLFHHQETQCSIRKYYHCYVCDYTAVTPSRIKSHLQNIHPAVKYNKETLKCTDARKLPKNFRPTCSQCGKQFKNHECLNRHIPFCRKTKEIIKSSSDLQFKVNKDFQDMIIRFCKKCEKVTQVFHVGVSRLQPCQKCKLPNVFKCLKCNKEYNFYNSILNHTRTCGLVDIRKKKVHPRYSSQKTIYCTHCNKPFLQKASLEKHFSLCTVLHPKPNTCEHLGRRHAHLKSSCKNCNAPQTISDRRKFCYKCKSGLQFRCQICDQNFSDSYDSWCEHLKTYFDRVKYQCDDCGAGFVTKHYFTNHFAFCNKTKLCCDMCDFTTKFKNSLNRHVMFMHPVIQS